MPRHPEALDERYRPFLSANRIADNHIKPRTWIPALAFLVALLTIGTTGFLLFKPHALEVERKRRMSSPRSPT